MRIVKKHQTERLKKVNIENSGIYQILYSHICHHKTRICWHKYVHTISSLCLKSFVCKNLKSELRSTYIWKTKKILWILQNSTVWKMHIHTYIRMSPTTSSLRTVKFPIKIMLQNSNNLMCPIQSTQIMKANAINLMKCKLFAQVMPTTTNCIKTKRTMYD